MIFILVHLLVMAAFAQGPDKEVAPPLSVCELVAHRSEYNGRLVTVRGEAKSGAHGGWLTASSECQYQLVTRGITWPNDIYLAYPDNRSRIEENHANFEIDWKSIQKAEEAVRRSGFNRQTDHIIETYVGRFVTYVDLENRVNPGLPAGRRLGFGPVGLDAPAQLLVKSVKDVVVVHGTKN